MNELIQQVQQGNKAAGERLYQLNERFWFRICLRYGKNRTEAREIFQEGVIAIFSNLKQFDPKRGVFQGWSNRIMVNAALAYLKKQHAKGIHQELEEAYEIPDKETNILDKIAVKELIAIVQQLPLAYRLVFNLYVIEGYTHPEIATMLDIPVGTSKSRLSKAKKLLRQQLEVLLLK